MIMGCKLLPRELGPMLSQMAGEKLESVFRSGSALSSWGL